MPGTPQKQLLLNVFENLPGLSFLVLSQATADLRLAGWIATVLAMLVCGAYVRRALAPHPVLLGINLFTLAVTPAIECLFLLDMAEQARWLVANVDSAVLASVFVTGLLLTAAAPNGFLSRPTETRKQMLACSALLLAASAMGTAWSVVVDSGPLLSLAVPLSLLFGLRQFLCAGLSDHRSPDRGLVVPPTAVATSLEFTG